MSWSREAITALIDNYKKHSCLYAVRSPLYHNKYARQSALQAVANSLSPWRPTTAEEVKAKFNNLRTAFLTEKKLSSRTKRKPTEPEYMTNLWYYDKIKYIEEHIIPRISRGNVYEDFESLQGTPMHGGPVQLPGHDNFEVIISDDFNTTTSSSSSCSVSIGKKRKVEPEDPEDVMSVSSLDAEPPPPPPAGSDEWWTVNPGSSDPLQEFGNFIVSRLRRIRDTDILLKLEHEIQLKIMEAELKDSLTGDS